MSEILVLLFLYSIIPFLTHTSPPPGCWCPEGKVMSHAQQCVSPEDCPCEVAGVQYWPGQQIKMDCDICVCERGRPQRCQPNTDCSGKYNKSSDINFKSHTFQVFSHRHPCLMLVHCGWSSWSEWGECLGPCGVQSVQWSFRSPNNPTKHGDGRVCRGIYRKARRLVPVYSNSPSVQCPNKNNSTTTPGSQ